MEWTNGRRVGQLTNQSGLGSWVGVAECFRQRVRGGPAVVYGLRQIMDILNIKAWNYSRRPKFNMCMAKMWALWLEGLQTADTWLFTYRRTHHQKVYWCLWLERQPWRVRTTPPPSTRQTHISASYPWSMPTWELAGSWWMAGDQQLRRCCSSLDGSWDMARFFPSFHLVTALHCTVSACASDQIFYICLFLRFPARLRIQQTFLICGCSKRKLSNCCAPPHTPHTTSPSILSAKQSALLAFPVGKCPPFPYSFLLLCGASIPADACGLMAQHPPPPHS